MSAELISISVDFIDTLLEDWYPGLGAREGSKTMESIPYVNRVIPCPYCFGGAVMVEEDIAQVCVRTCVYLYIRMCTCVCA